MTIDTIMQAIAALDPATTTAPDLLGALRPLLRAQYDRDPRQPQRMAATMIGVVEVMLTLSPPEPTP